MVTSTTKILTVGSTVGAIHELFAKVKAIDAKHGKFDVLLCIGDFFGPPKEETRSNDDEVSQLLDGRLEAPIECYIMQGEYPLPSRVVEKFAKTGGELCKNVFLMSKSGMVTTTNHLRIACLGGTYEPEIFNTAESAPGFMSPFFSHHTVDRLLSNTLTSSTRSNKQKTSYSSLASIQASSSSSQLIDILLTNSWPSCITQFSEAAPASHRPDLGSPPLDEVVRKTKPRYHFAASSRERGQMPKFWEREPYLWDEEKGRVSRFVSLGAFGGEPVTGKKQRWFYAFSIASPTPNEIHPRPGNATKNPFLESATRLHKRPLDMDGGENFIFGNVPHPQKRSRVVQGEPGKPPPGYKCRRCESTEHFINDCPERSKPPENYICKVCHEPGHFVRDCPTRHEVGDTGGKKPKPGYICRACGSENHYLEDCLVANPRIPQSEKRAKRGPPKEIAPDECWFCLSNPNLAKHLIVAIGTECYVTLPKGQLIPTQSAAEHVDVPGGGHVLVVPITHYPTYSTIPPDLSSPIVEETEQYKNALSTMYAKYRSVPVNFEVGRLSAKGGHAHVQAVPVPQHLKETIEDAFIQEGRMQGIDFEEDAEAAMNSYADGRCGYFKIDLPDGRKLVHLMKDGVPFNLQFGRQVLATLLGIPDRLDWKACKLSEEEDRLDAEAFKKAFAPFNPFA